MYIKEE